MSWLSRNAEQIEAVAATVTALVAVAALVGVKLQIDEAERLQQDQSARDAYRAHLALAATLPQFNDPGATCGVLASDQAGAYVAFVDHLLYSAEQMLAVGEGWETTFLDELTTHQDYICAPFGPEADTEETQRLLQVFRQTTCIADVQCPNVE